MKKDPTSDQYKLSPPEAVTAGPMPHPGPFIQSLLADFKCPVSTATAKMGINRAHFIDVLKGKANLTADVAYRLEALTGFDADLLIAMQARHERDRDADKREAYKSAIERLPDPPVNEAPQARAERKG